MSGLTAAQLHRAIDRASHAFKPSADGLAVETGDRGYRATIGEGGLAFIAESVGDEPAVTARFQTRGLRWGSQNWAVGASAAADWQVVGNTAQRLVPGALGLVEHYQASHTGIAVTWVLPTTPAVWADLEIEAELTGVQVCRQTAAGCHFAEAGGLARVKFGPALAVDQQGRSWPLLVSAAGERVSIAVPATILAQAQFPLAIDPILSAEIGLDQPLDSPAACTQAAPAVAGNDSVYLVVWTRGQSESSLPGVYGARVDPAGNLLDRYGIQLSRLAGEQTVCAVAANADSFLVAWSAPHTNSVNDWDILGVRVSTEGTIAAPAPLPICTLATSLQSSPAVAANGENFLVCWRDSRGTGIYGTIVQADGQIVVSNGFPICTAVNEQFTPAVAALGTNYLVAWQDYRKASSTQFTSDIYGARVTGAGVVLDTNGIAIGTRTNSQFHPAVAANGTNYLVVWEDYDPQGDDIYGARVSAEGLLLDTDALVITHGTNLQANPAVIGVAGDFLVVWQDFRDAGARVFAARTYGARVRGDGTVADPDGVALSSGTDGQAYPAVAQRENRALIVWQDGRGNPSGSWSDIMGTAVALTAPLVPGLDSRLSGAVNQQVAPAVAANGTNFLVVWTDLRNQATNGPDIYGVRVAQDGTVLDPLALAICTATNIQGDPAAAGNGSDYLVVWSDWRNTPPNATHGDIYGSLVSGDGVVRQPEGLPICTATNDQAFPAVSVLGTNFLVVWQDARSTPAYVLRYDIYGARVSGQGLLLDPAGVPLCTNIMSQATPVVAGNTGQALVVWVDPRNVGVNTDIYGVRVDVEGMVLDTNDLPICRAALVQAAPAVATDGHDYFVVWADGRNGAASGQDIYGVRVTADGAIEPTNGIPVAVGTGQQTAPTVSFNGLDYLVAWQEASPGVSNAFAIYGAGVSSQGRAFGGAPLLISNGTNNQQAPAVAADADARFLVVNQGSLYQANRTLSRMVDFEAIPRLEPGALLADGRFQFRLRGAPGCSYSLQCSEDLQTWTPLETISCTNYSLLWTDASASNRVQRFYRALLLP